jgi:predicted enzyme related to lactoylglutathione lyase
MNRVIHFEIQADEPERAIKFYSEIFSWKITKWDQPGQDYWLIKTGDKKTPGIDGGLIQRMIPVTNDDVITYLCTIAVENIDTMMMKIEDEGGKVVDSKREIPKIGWNAICKDTEGNYFSILEPSDEMMNM